MSEPKTYTEEEFNELQTKADESKTKLDEFRTNNVKLMKDMDALNAKFEGIDLDVYNDMVEKQQKLNDKKLIDEGKIDELLEEKTRAMRDVHNKEIEKSEKVNQTLQTQLASLVIDNAVRDTAVKAGIVETAMDDILLRSKSVFSLKDGKAVPSDATGNVIFGLGTSEPMSVEEWVKGQMEIAPHLFKPSNGSGSQHKSNTAGSNSSNMSALEKLQTGFAK